MNTSFADRFVRPGFGRLNACIRVHDAKGLLRFLAVAFDVQSEDPSLQPLHLIRHQTIGVPGRRKLTALS